MRKQIIETLIVLAILGLIIFIILKINEPKRTYVYSYENKLYESDECLTDEKQKIVCKNGDNFVEVQFYYYEK